LPPLSSLSGCTILPHEIIKNSDFLVQGTDLLGELTDALIDFDDAKQKICGTIDNPAILAGVSQAINEELCTVAGLLKRVRMLCQCSTWYPLYETTVYDTLCYSVPSFSWIASTQLIVVFMAMVILTCRVVLLSQSEEQAAETNIDFSDNAQSPNPGLETVDDRQDVQEMENGEEHSDSQSIAYSA
jgi:hypothetical protein